MNDYYDFFNTVHVWIDEFTYCLVDNRNSQEVLSYVEFIEDWNLLQGYNADTGWYVDWTGTGWTPDTEIYALKVEGDDEIQGLVAVKNNDEYDSADVVWAVAAPHNNPKIVGHSKKRYSGVGGHLFAIAAYCSVEWGHEGNLVCDAADEDLVHHYEETFGAYWAHMRHPYHVVFSKQTGKRLLNTYTFEMR